MDQELLAVRDGLIAKAGSREKLADVLSEVVRTSLDFVIDGPNTGRWSIDELDKPEKTYIGTRIQVRFAYALKLTGGTELDYSVSNIDADMKSTIRNNWMIPREAVGKICILVRVNERKSTCALGILRALPIYLGKGRNQDKKRSINKIGKETVDWLIEDFPIRTNFLYHLDADQRENIFSVRKGLSRVKQIFRIAHSRPIPRTAIEVVAEQKDPMRRIRGGTSGSRKELFREGLVIASGSWKNTNPLLRCLGLEELKRDEWMSIPLEIIHTRGCEKLARPLIKKSSS